jgi:hypothetical protein
VGVIEMIVVEGLMTILIIILAIKLRYYENRLDLINDDLEESIAEIKELKQRCDGHKELIEALSKSVRELNGVVEEAVNVKEQTSDNKPDIKALIGGWTTDDKETTWLEDILAKIRKKKEKPVDDTYYLGVGVDDDKMLRIPVRDTGQTLVDGEPIRHGRLWTNSEGRIYELPEGCYISGDTSYEMDQ